MKPLKDVHDSSEECGASIACNAMKSGACCPVHENDCLILFCIKLYAVRMWAYTGPNNAWISSWADMYRTCTTFLCVFNTINILFTHSFNVCTNIQSWGPTDSPVTGVPSTSLLGYV